MQNLSFLTKRFYFTQIQRNNIITCNTQVNKFTFHKIQKVGPIFIVLQIANKSIKVIDAMKLSAKTNKLVEIKN